MAITVIQRKSPAIQRAVLETTVVNSAADTLADVTGLSIPVKSGKAYKFKAVCLYDAAATTTGSRWTINGPTATSLGYKSSYTLTATTETLNSGLAAYQLPAAASATSLTDNNVAAIEGVVIPSADGNLVVQFASEVGASAITAQAGSFLEVVEV